MDFAQSRNECSDVEALSRRGCVARYEHVAEGFLFRSGGICLLFGDSFSLAFFSNVKCGIGGWFTGGEYRIACGFLVYSAFLSKILMSERFMVYCAGAINILVFL